MATRKARYYPSFDEAVSRALQNNPHIAESSVKTLAERGVKATGAGYAWAHDPALGIPVTSAKYIQTRPTKLVS